MLKDTVWHAGLMYKLAEFQCPLYIWHLLDKWYSQSTSAVLWNSCISRSFRIQQGVRQGAIPSLHRLVKSLNLPPIPDILSGGWSKISWKRYVKRLLLSSEYSAFLDSCDHLPLSNCLVRLGSPYHIGW